MRKAKKTTKFDTVKARNVALKRLWRAEGVDAALLCAKFFGMTKRQVWDMIGRWMFK